MRIKVHRSAKVDLLDGAVRVYAVLDNRADPQTNEDRLDAADDLNP